MCKVFPEWCPDGLEEDAAFQSDIHPGEKWAERVEDSPASHDFKGNDHQGEASPPLPQAASPHVQRAPS